jgi:hypothetical protein
VCVGVCGCVCICVYLVECQMTYSFCRSLRQVSHGSCQGRTRCGAHWVGRGGRNTLLAHPGETSLPAVFRLSQFLFLFKFVSTHYHISNLQNRISSHQFQQLTCTRILGTSPHPGISHVPMPPFQNSWGTNWGLRGFAKIRRGTNEAGPIPFKGADVWILRDSPKKNIQFCVNHNSFTSRRYPV